MGPPLTEVPAQELPGQPPCRLTRSKAAVASVGAPLLDPPVSCWLACRRVLRGGGEQPGLHRRCQPGQGDGADLGPAGSVGGVVAGDDVAGPGQAQPARRRRGHAARQPGRVAGVVPLHPGAVAAGDHDGRVRRSLAGACGDDQPGLGPRHQGGLGACRPLRGQAAVDHAGQRGHPHGDGAVRGQRAVHEVVGVGHRLAARPGRDRVMARAAGAAFLAADPGVQAEQQGHQRRDDDGDDPAADRAELGPLRVQQAREAVVPGCRARPGRRQGGGGHRAASLAGSARYSTASLVSSM